MNRKQMEAHLELHGWEIKNVNRDAYMYYNGRLMYVASDEFPYAPSTASWGDIRDVVFRRLYKLVEDMYAF